MNYTDDGCSGPTWADVETTLNRACQRHDFGYRNFGKERKLWRNVTAKERSDDKLVADAYAICRGKEDPIIWAGVAFIRCSRAAQLMGPAMNTFWASDAFFGKNSCPFGSSPPSDLQWLTLSHRDKLRVYLCNIAFFGGTGLPQEARWRDLRPIIA